MNATQQMAQMDMHDDHRDDRRSHIAFCLNASEVKNG